MISIYWLPLLVLLVALGYLGLRRLRGRPQLTIIEVTSFLRPTHAEEVLKALNPLLEEVLGGTFTRRNFLSSQRDRLHKMKEHVSCMSHDAHIFLQLANTELWRETKFKPGMEDSEKYIELAQKLHRAAVEFICVATLTLWRINFWLLFRTQWWVPLPAPRISNLGQTAGLKLHASYRKFRDAVGALCLQYGEEFYDEIMPMI